MSDNKIELPFESLKQRCNKMIIIYLKNDYIYKGILKDIDNYFNIKLSEAILTIDNNTYGYSEVCIRGSSIKYFNFYNN